MKLIIKELKINRGPLQVGRQQFDLLSFLPLILVLFKFWTYPAGHYAYSQEGWQQFYKVKLSLS